MDIAFVSSASQQSLIDVYVGFSSAVDNRGISLGLTLKYMLTLVILV